MAGIWRSIWRRLRPEKRPDIKAYEWVQVSGPATQLSTDNNGKATFFPPVYGTYVWKVRVQYADGSVDTDEITINVQRENK